MLFRIFGLANFFTNFFLKINIIILILKFQACQGDQLDAGMHLKKVAYTETDSNAMSYKIPSHADFLIAYR